MNVFHMLTIKLKQIHLTDIHLSQQASHSVQEFEIYLYSQFLLFCYIIYQTYSLSLGWRLES